MSGMRKDHACAHGLVPSGYACPECLWWQMAGQNVPTRETIEPAWRAFDCACIKAVVPQLRAQVQAELERGRWYGLRFLRRLRAQEPVR